MHSVLRPNYRRDRAPSFGIEGARVHLEEGGGGPLHALTRGRRGAPGSRAGVKPRR